MIEWLHNTWAVDLLFVFFLGERLSSNYAEQALLQQLTAGEIKLPEDASSERLGK